MTNLLRFQHNHRSQFIKTYFKCFINVNGIGSGYWFNVFITFLIEPINLIKCHYVRVTTQAKLQKQIKLI